MLTICHLLTKIHQIKYQQLSVLEAHRPLPPCKEA